VVWPTEPVVPRPASVPLRAVFPTIVACALLASAISLLLLGREAHRRVDERTAIQRLRSDVVRVQSLGWHGLALGAPNFTIATEAKALRARAERETAALPTPAGGPEERDRVGRLVAELLDAVDRELHDLHPSTTLQGTSDLLDGALDAAERHAMARTSAANARLLRGGLVVVGVAAGLTAVFLLVIRRVRRRGDERFRALVEQSGEILVVVDADGRIADVTAAAVRRTLGFDGATLIGRRVDELVEAVDAPRVRAALERLTTDPSPPTPRPSFEVAVRDAHGGRVHLEAIGNNLLHLPAVGGLVLTLRDVSERRAMEDALRHQAFHDGLTGLPNRALFDDRLAQALARARRGEGQVAVVLVDLDDFKAVNDSLGHAAGDALLIECGRRFDALVRATDTAARLGGDEFAVLVEDRDDAAGAAADVARRLRAALDRPLTVDGRDLHVAASVGVAVAEDPAVSPLDVVRNADIAMYEAKGRGGGDLVAFEPAMLDHARERLDLREHLRGALERGELSVHYQPIVGLGDGRPTAVEALLRWTHPELGAVSPARFIPVAEEAGMIGELGAWVLERACRDLVALQERADGVRVSVNVSAVQLRDPGFPAQVAAILQRTGAAPGDVVLELTESVFAGGEQVAVALRALRALGVALSVDDFGTGYSSLSYLRNLEVDSVKIDRSFVAGLGEEARDAALVRSIVELGHALGLTMVAEGVEHAIQERFLRDAGCDLAQGWRFGRPGPVEDADRWIVTGPAAARG
jgi:diguanylate cyclase (GGDEF)-like protein/PAS domain S-box-containing protein